jgi:hypothetical protein
LQDLGQIESYEFGKSIPVNSGEIKGDDEDDNIDWDWALIRIPPDLYLSNIVKSPERRPYISKAAPFSSGSIGSEATSQWPRVDKQDENIWVEGYLRDGELDNGAVLVCSGNSGTQQGILCCNSTSMLMGDVFFEFKEIILEHALGKLKLLVLS